MRLRPNIPDILDCIGRMCQTKEVLLGFPTRLSRRALHLWDLEGIRNSIKKSYPKFRSTQPNLLVVADDRFMPLATWGQLPAEQALFITNTALDGEVGYFTTKQFENLGGIALFKAELPVGKRLEYTFLLYPNPVSRAETALPSTFIEQFVNARSAGATCRPRSDLRGKRTQSRVKPFNSSVSSCGFSCFRVDSSRPSLVPIRQERC